jgi:hypothetical protein
MNRMLEAVATAFRTRSRVVLPRRTAARFPDRCVLCGKDRPGSSTRVVARDGLAGRRLASGWFAVRVPCCLACGWRLQLGRLGGGLRTLAVGFGGIALAGVGLHRAFGLDGFVLGLSSFGITLAFLVVLVLWEQAHPPAFALDVHRDTVEYEFRSRDRARDFAAINGVGLEDSDDFRCDLPGDTHE